jgi:hypothetical protein
MRRLALAAAVLAGMFAFAASSASATVVWLCKPGIARNPCEIPQDTTYQSSLLKGTVVTPRNGPRQVDCFYVYPTVSNDLSANSDKSRDPELVSIAKYQAARFNQQCRIYAPIYRQRTLLSLTLASVGAQLPVQKELLPGDFELAYSDVVEAWRDYLAHDNDGRGVVLIGHSQGTRMLKDLIRREIELKPEQHRLLVAAILLGGNVTVPAGGTVGGDFASTPLCTQPDQLGCVVAYSSFAEDPADDSRFGHAPAGQEIACTDPRPLAGESGPFRLLTPSELFAPGLLLAGTIITATGKPPQIGLLPVATTTWVSPKDRWDGGCKTINGAHVLRIEPRKGSRRLMWFPEPSWGTHLVDVNIALDPLVVLVGRLARDWAA